MICFCRQRRGIGFITTDHIDRWIKKLANYTIVDLEINEFSMEDIFIHYYEGDEK